MAARVRIDVPPGKRASYGHGGEWVVGRGASGAAPWYDDLTRLLAALPSDQARALLKAEVAEMMRAAAAGQVPGDLVDLMQCAPDVLELRLGEWWFAGGKMHVRLYFSEPWALPGKLVALRIRFKRPGPVGLEQQNGHAKEASDLLFGFQNRGFC